MSDGVRIAIENTLAMAVKYEEMAVEFRKSGNVSAEQEAQTTSDWLFNLAEKKEKSENQFLSFPLGT